LIPDKHRIFLSHDSFSCENTIEGKRWPQLPRQHMNPRSSWERPWSYQ
jgi:hypothetical protein